MENKPKFKVLCVVPTHYQVQSLSTLMGGFERWGGGRFGYQWQFLSISEAKKWMRDRNDALYSWGHLETKEWKQNKHDIHFHRVMTYDAATCSIEEIEPVEAEEED